MYWRAHLSPFPPPPLISLSPLPPPFPPPTPSSHTPYSLPLPQSGIVTIALYDTSRDRINESEAFDIAAVDLRLSEPAKRCKVQLISGKNAGSTGVVSGTMGDDGR